MEAQQRTITVSGRGTVSTPPDLGHLRLGVRVTDPDPDTALRSSNERVARLQETLIGAGIAEDDVNLGRFSIDSVYDRVDGRRVLQGYEVRHDLTVTVREIARTGEFLSVAVNAGADHVGGVSFSVEDPSASLDLARERAFEDAHHKARELARLASIQLGPVVVMQETARGPVPIVRSQMQTRAASFAMAERPPDVPINPDEADFSVDIEVVWEIA